MEALDLHSSLQSVAPIISYPVVALPVVALILLKVLDILISDAIDRSGFFGTATQSPPTLPISLQTGTDRANKWEIIDGKYQGPRFAMCNADGSDFGNKDVLAKTADGIWTSLYPIASTIPGTPAGYTIPEVTTHADRAALAKHIHDTWDTQFSRLDFFGNMGVPYPNKAFLVTNSYTNAPAGLTMGVDVALNGTAVSYREMSSVFSLFKSALANSVSGKSLKLKSSYKDFPQESVAGINVVHLVAGYFFTPICQCLSLRPDLTQSSVCFPCLPLHLTQFPSLLLLSFSRRSTSSA